MSVITLKVRATVRVQVAQRFGHKNVEVQSATEVEVLDEVSLDYYVRSDIRRKTKLHKTYTSKHYGFVVYSYVVVHWGESDYKKRLVVQNNLVYY